MSEGIAYQNKDIEFKILSEAYRERSFEAYGLKIPRIKEVLPTDLPAVSANEMRIRRGKDKEGDHDDEGRETDL